MAQAFKYLRFITAIILPICVVYNFGRNIVIQSKTMLDGPLAHYFSYTFSINKIILALCLSVVLLFGFTLNLPRWGNGFLRITGILSVLLSLIGFLYLFKQSHFMGSFTMFGELYLFQLAYLLISLIIWAKSFEGKNDA